MDAAQGSILAQRDIFSAMLSVASTYLRTQLAPVKRFPERYRSIPFFCAQPNLKHVNIPGKYDTHYRASTAKSKPGSIYIHTYFEEYSVNGSNRPPSLHLNPPA